jgi:hypothetical protein
VPLNDGAVAAQNLDEQRDRTSTVDSPYKNILYKNNHSIRILMFGPDCFCKINKNNHPIRRVHPSGPDRILIGRVDFTRKRNCFVLFCFNSNADRGLKGLDKYAGQKKFKLHVAGKSDTSDFW